jgi:RNA methyltransferase, TrmH family
LHHPSPQERTLVNDTITSSSNSKIKWVRSLQGRSRNRKAEGAFVAEGVRLLEEAAQQNWPADLVLYDETLSERGWRVLEKLSEQEGLERAKIAPDLMAEISDTETPQGILAVLQRGALPLPENPDFVILADGIRDPGNLGTLLRTAEAAGADGLLLAPGTVDAYSPKVVRAGMGAHFHLPIHHQHWEAIQYALRGLTIFVADTEGALSLWEVNFRQPCALLIGGEAFGASPQGRSLADQAVRIPMPGRVESLNAAIAAGILIAEVLRQRYMKE